MALRQFQEYLKGTVSIGRDLNDHVQEKSHGDFKSLLKEQGFNPWFVSSMLVFAAASQPVAPLLGGNGLHLW